MYSQHYTKWRTPETIPLKVRNETGLSAFSTPIQYSFGIPNKAVRKEQEVKWIQTGKEESNYHPIPKRPQKLYQK
jgi:hypothetical protein